MASGRTRVNADASEALGRRVSVDADGEWTHEGERRWRASERVRQMEMAAEDRRMREAEEDAEADGERAVGASGEPRNMSLRIHARHTHKTESGAPPPRPGGPPEGSRQ